MDDDILHYRSALDYNRNVFLIERAELFKTFSTVDGNFAALIEQPRTMRDRDGKSYVSLIPFIFLLQRQGRAAFEALAAYQAYQAWVLLRPGIESVLIIGKWVDDSANAKIWQDRHKNRKLYRDTFSGQGLVSNSLPSAEAIRRVLSRVNDDFVHANPDYYYRHLEANADGARSVQFWLNYFDPDELHDAHVLAFLRFSLTMQEALSGLFARLFGKRAQLNGSVSSFDSQFRTRMKELAAKSEEAAKALEELGLFQRKNS